MSKKNKAEGMFAQTLQAGAWQEAYWKSYIQRHEAQQVFDSQEEWVTERLTEMTEKLVEMEMVITFLLQRSGAPPEEFAQWVKATVEKRRAQIAEEQKNNPQPQRTGEKLIIEAN